MSSNLNLNKNNNTKPDLAEKEKMIKLLEEDDYFEDFNEEDWDEKAIKEHTDFKQWQENWEDDEVDDKFENQIRAEIEKFKKSK